MSFIRYINRLKYLDYMIRKKATGDLETFAKKNNLSKRGLSDVLNEMKEMGFPIKFDRSRRTYYYDEEGEMVKCLFFRYGEVLSREESRMVAAVDKLCFSPSAVFTPCGDL